MIRLDTRYAWRSGSILLGATLGLILLTTAIVLGWPCDPRAPLQDGSYHHWEMAPMIVASKGETLFFMTTLSVPAYQETTAGAEAVRRPLWHALGGRILYMTEEWVVYRTPNMEGIYLLYWESADRRQRFGVLIRVKEHPIGDQTLPRSEFAGYYGAYVPLINGSEAPTALFLARARTKKPDRPAPPDFMDNQGNIDIDLPLRPILPRPNRPCQGNNRTNESVQIENAQWRELAGTLTIDAQLAASLRELLGINVSVGTTINVYAEWRRVVRFRMVDCYRCENGAWRWVGSRVEYETCTYLEGYTPPWICRAVDLGVLTNFICPKEPIYDKNCVSIGDCPCPPNTPIIVGPGYKSPCSKMTGE
ncbi:MAG: hypothetical protein KatS3mg017_0653 [Fimbriimonadales bacterium]|nr:MAG: hypothetical protein KatS3mg017_0653 [Fimbriimonadales bacterium]